MCVRDASAGDARDVEIAWDQDVDFARTLESVETPRWVETVVQNLVGAVSGRHKEEFGVHCKQSLFDLLSVPARCESNHVDVLRVALVSHDSRPGIDRE